MIFNLIERLRRSRPLRMFALAYGLVFFNIGLLALYNEFARPPVTFNETLRWGLASFAMGAAALFLFFRSKPE